MFDGLFEFIYEIFWRLEVLLCLVVKWMQQLFNAFTGVSTVSYHGSDEYLTNVFFSNPVANGIYLGMAAIGIAFIFIFAIISVIKKLFDLDDKVKMSYGQIFRSMFKALLVIVSMNLIMTVSLAFTNQLMRTIDKIFTNGSKYAEGAQHIDYTDEQFAAMGRILNTIGNYSLNPSYKSRYNLNSCYNEIRGDLKYLADTKVFNYYYPNTDADGNPDNTWQYAIQQIVQAGDYSSEVPIDQYEENEGIINAITECMEMMKTDPSFHALESYDRANEQTVDTVPLDTTLFLIGTMGNGSTAAARQVMYNEHPDLMDNARRPYYIGQKSIYDLDDVNEDFDISLSTTNYVIVFVGCYVIITNMALILVDCVVRIFNLLFMYLIAPPIVATMPLDDGTKFKQWTTAFIVQLFSVFATVISMRVFLVFIPIIMSSDLTLADNALLNMVGKLVMLWAGCKAVEKANGILTGILTDNAGAQSLMAGDMRQELKDSGVGQAGRYLEAKAVKGAGKVLGTAGSIATLPIRPITGALSALGGKIASTYRSVNQAWGDIVPDLIRGKYSNKSNNLGSAAKKDTPKDSGGNNKADGGLSQSQRNIGGGDKNDPNNGGKPGGPTKPNKPNGPTKPGGPGGGKPSNPGGGGQNKSGSGGQNKSGSGGQNKSGGGGQNKSGGGNSGNKLPNNNRQNPPERRGSHSNQQNHAEDKGKPDKNAQPDGAGNNAGQNVPANQRGLANGEDFDPNDPAQNFLYGDDGGDGDAGGEAYERGGSSVMGIAEGNDSIGGNGGGEDRKSVPNAVNRKMNLDNPKADGNNNGTQQAAGNRSKSDAGANNGSKTAVPNQKKANSPSKRGGMDRSNSVPGGNTDKQQKNTGIPANHSGRKTAGGQANAGSAGKKNDNADPNDEKNMEPKDENQSGNNRSSKNLHHQAGDHHIAGQPEQSEQNPQEMEKASELPNHQRVSENAGDDGKDDQNSERAYSVPNISQKSMMDGNDPAEKNTNRFSVQSGIRNNGKKNTAKGGNQAPESKNSSAAKQSAGGNQNRNMPANLRDIPDNSDNPRSVDVSRAEEKKTDDNDNPVQNSGGNVFNSGNQSGSKEHTHSGGMQNAGDDQQSENVIGSGQEPKNSLPERQRGFSGGAELSDNQRDDGKMSSEKGNIQNRQRADSAVSLRGKQHNGGSLSEKSSEHSAVSSANGKAAENVSSADRGSMNTSSNSVIPQSSGRLNPVNGSRVQSDADLSGDDASQAEKRQVKFGSENASDAEMRPAGNVPRNQRNLGGASVRSIPNVQSPAQEKDDNSSANDSHVSDRKIDDYAERQSGSVIESEMNGNESGLPQHSAGSEKHEGNGIHSSEGTEHRGSHRAGTFSNLPNRQTSVSEKTQKSEQRNNAVSANLPDVSEIETESSGIGGQNAARNSIPQNQRYQANSGSRQADGSGSDVRGTIPGSGNGTGSSFSQSNTSDAEKKTALTGMVHSYPDAIPQNQGNSIFNSTDIGQTDGVFSGGQEPVSGNAAEQRTANTGYSGNSQSAVSTNHPHIPTGERMLNSVEHPAADKSVAENVQNAEQIVPQEIPVVSGYQGTQRTQHEPIQSSQPQNVGTIPHRNTVNAGRTENPVQQEQKLSSGKMTTEGKPIKGTNRRNSVDSYVQEQFRKLDQDSPQRQDGKNEFGQPTLPTNNRS